MENFLTLTNYGKKIDGYMQKITKFSNTTGEVQTELFSLLEVLHESTGGKILLLFIEVSLQFFSRLLDIIFSKENVFGNDRLSRDRMFKIDHYIQTNLDREMNVKDVADYIGMSVGYFSRFFAKMFKCRFVEYLTHCRINSASKKLIETDMKIVEISDISGFRSHNQFNRVFKEEMQMTPSEYREKYKKDDRYHRKR